MAYLVSGLTASTVPPDDFGTVLGNLMVANGWTLLDTFTATSYRHRVYRRTSDNLVLATTNSTSGSSTSIWIHLADSYDVGTKVLTRRFGVPQTHTYDAQGYYGNTTLNASAPAHQGFRVDGANINFIMVCTGKLLMFQTDLGDKFFLDDYDSFWPENVVSRKTIAYHWHASGSNHFMHTYQVPNVSASGGTVGALSSPFSASLTFGFHRNAVTGARLLGPLPHYPPLGTTAGLVTGANTPLGYYSTVKLVYTGTAPAVLGDTVTDEDGKVYYLWGYPGATTLGLCFLREA